MQWHYNGKDTSMNTVSVDVAVSFMSVDTLLAVALDTLDYFQHQEAAATRAAALTEIVNRLEPYEIKQALASRGLRMVYEVDRA